jgi:hypothetical protein
MPKPKEESTVRFIQCVHVHDLLWDRSHPDHKDFNKRSVAWETIANFCGFESKFVGYFEYRVVKQKIHLAKVSMGYK